MFKIIKLLAFCLLLVSLSACSSLSRKVPIEQGNTFNQEMVNQLKPGMSMAQVEQIMGQPVLSSIFNSNRLDYVYTYRKGKKYNHQRVSLIFKDNKLTQVNGSLVPQSDY